MFGLVRFEVLGLFVTFFAVIVFLVGCSVSVSVSVSAVFVMVILVGCVVVIIGVCWGGRLAVRFGVENLVILRLLLLLSLLLLFSVFFWSLFYSRLVTGMY